MDGKRVAPAALVLFGVLAACNVAGAPSQNKVGGEPIRPVRLTMADTNSHNLIVDNFVDKVKANSGGAIEITVTRDWRRGEPDYEVGEIKDVADGKADLGFVAARAFDSVGVTSFQAILAPFLVDSSELQKKVLASKTAKSLLEGVQSAGVVGLGYTAGPFRRPIGITKAFTKPADFSGATIRAEQSRVAELTFQALGATVSHKPYGEISGIDGFEGNLSSARDYLEGGLYAFTSNVNLWPRPDVVFVNSSRFAGLTDGQREILRTAAQSTQEESFNTLESTTGELHSILCALGLSFVTATDAELAAFRQAVAPVYTELEQDAKTKAAIAEIRAMRSSDARPLSLDPCPQPEITPSVAGPSPIDGTWTTSYSRDEFANSPLLLDRGEINDQNWGDLKLVMADGRVTFTQSNPIDHYTTSGFFTVKNNDVTFKFVDGGNAGETFLFRWSLFQGSLSFERHPSMPISPTPYVLKPWTPSN